MSKKNMATRKTQKQKLQMECAKILLEDEIQQDEEEYMKYFPSDPFEEDAYVEEDEEEYLGELMTDDEYLECLGLI